MSIHGIPECYHTFTVTLHSYSQNGSIVVEFKAVRIHSVLSALCQSVHKTLFSEFWEKEGATEIEKRRFVERHVVSSSSGNVSILK